MLCKSYLRVPLSWFAPDTGWMWRWSYKATLVPTRWIFISHSFLSADLTHLQVDAEIEVAGENEKEQDSKEAETEVSKSQIHDVSFFLGALYPSNILPIILLSGLIFPVKNGGIQSSKTAAGVVHSKMQRIG